MDILKFYNNESQQWTEVPALKGSNGLYIGSTEPTDPDIHVWIDTTSSGIEAVTSVDGQTGDVTVDSFAYPTGLDIYHATIKECMEYAVAHPGKIFSWTMWTIPDYAPLNEEHHWTFTLYVPERIHCVFNYVIFEAQITDYDKVMLWRADGTTNPNWKQIYPGLSIVGPLWENASPTSTFAAQTISLDLSKYDAIILIAQDIDTEPESYYISMNYGSTYIYGHRDLANSNTVPLTYRHVSASNTGIVFSDGQYKMLNGSNSPTVRNDFRVPTVIYGVKGVKTQ